MWLGVPYRTMQEWELGRRAMPEYVLRLIAYKVMNELREGGLVNMFVLRKILKLCCCRLLLFCSLRGGHWKLQ